LSEEDSVDAVTVQSVPQLEAGQRIDADIVANNNVIGSVTVNRTNEGVIIDVTDKLDVMQSYCIEDHEFDL